MIGHAVSNSCYLAAANRVGTERIEDHEQTYYGTSFIADYQGEVLAEANRTEEAVMATLDLDAARSFRAGMGFFRDRRPDLYARSSHRTERRRADDPPAAGDRAVAAGMIRGRPGAPVAGSLEPP